MLKLTVSYASWRHVPPAGICLMLLSIIFLPILGCTKTATEAKTEALADSADESYDDSLSQVLDNSSAVQYTTMVSLPGARKPLQVYTRQLADQATEEQIAITKHPELGNLELFLISPRVVSSIEGSVADYQIVAQEQLNIDTETFTVQTQDLTGDGAIQEIFITGQNVASGLQQVYVFQLLISDLEKNITGLRQIFYQQDNGSYEISYDEKGYYIVHQRLLDESSYQLELTNLKWSAGTESFVVRNIEIINNNEKLSDSLKAVYQGSAEDFFQELDGLWMRRGAGNVVSNAPQKIPTAESQMFLYFDSESNELLVYADTIGLEEGGQVIEVYDIASMTKSLWNRLNLNVHNKYVYNIQNYFYVTLEDSDTIKLFTLDGISYTGTYSRVNASNYQKYQSDSLMSIRPATFQLEGVFTESTGGKQYSFQPDRVILSESNGKTWEGSYSLFFWYGKNYLELHLFEVSNFEEFRSTYRIELGADDGERNSPKEPNVATSSKVQPSLDISVLLLYPVHLLQVEEIENTTENVIRLERKQKIDNRELENLLPG